MKVGILGGTFDPVHFGHLKLAQAALRQLRLDKVFLVPTPLSPFKKNKKMSPINQRVRWLKAALRGKKGLQLGPWEIHKKGPVYTFETLRAYKKFHPKHEIYFVMGSDSWKTFPRWKNPGGITKLAILVIGRRPGSSSIKISRRYKKSIVLLKGMFPKISSTQIRQK